MHPTLREHIHSLYDRIVHNHDTLEQPVVDVEVQVSPSTRITRPMESMSEGEQERDDGDRADGENWVDAATERALEGLQSDAPLVIEDEPTARHAPIVKG